MSRTIWAALAVFGLMTLPAAANCEAELSKLKDAVTAAETGATTAQSGVPATKHQEEVLTGNKAAAGTATTESSSGAAVEAVSPHQKEVMGAKGAADAAHPSDLMKEAGDLAKAGDETGCMDKVTQLKKLMGQ
jgi:hypothetical protein